MLRRIIASASVACLVVANAHADSNSSAESLPAPIEIANLAFDGQFSQWGIPSTYYFCTDVNNTMLIAQDLAYAYLLDIGYVDSLIAPIEGAPVSQGQAQVKGKDVPVSQGQTQAQGQAQVKGKLISSQQQNRPGIMRTDLDIRRFVDYTRALTDDEVMLVRENFDSEYLRNLNLQMRMMCGQ